jgi:retinol dehydrogenase-12
MHEPIHSIQVNHLSTALLSLRLLPLMQRTAERFDCHPRLVVVSSDMHFLVNIGAEVMGSPRILEKLSRREFCKPSWARTFHCTYINNKCTSGLWGLDTQRQSVRTLPHALRVDWPFGPVLNVLFTRALAASLPPTSQIIVNVVSPGYCISSIRRNLRFPVTVVVGIMDYIFARPTEEGARQLVWAALAGETDGGDSQLREKVRGTYVSDFCVAEESDWVFTNAGQDAERRIWVSNYSWSLNKPILTARGKDETAEILGKVDGKVQPVVEEYLRKPWGGELEKQVGNPTASVQRI